MAPGKKLKRKVSWVKEWTASLKESDSSWNLEENLPDHGNRRYDKVLNHSGPKLGCAKSVKYRGNSMNLLDNTFKLRATGSLYSFLQNLLVFDQNIVTFPDPQTFYNQVVQTSASNGNNNVTTKTIHLNYLLKLVT